MDEIEVVGDKVYLGGVQVAELCEGTATPSVLAKFVWMLDACNMDADRISAFHQWLDETGY